MRALGSAYMPPECRTKSFQLMALASIMVGGDAVKRFIQLVCVPVLLLFHASPACTAERGLVLDPEAADPQVMSSLESQIAQAKLETPGAFEELATIVAGLPNRPPSMSASMRDPIVNHLTPIGPAGLFPMLEMIVIRAPSAASLDQRLTRELGPSLVFAVGRIGDLRAVPILETILVADEVDIWARNAAARSIMLLPNDDAIAILFSILDSRVLSLDTRRAVYSVIGRSHRSVVADRLAEDLYGKPDPVTAKSIVTALGDLGNRGAWWSFAYSGDERLAEKDEATRVATEAMLWAFVEYVDPDVREAVGRGLRLIQHVSTQARIQEQRARASKELTTALNQLEESYLRSIESRR